MRAVRSAEGHLYVITATGSAKFRDNMLFLGTGWTLSNFESCLFPSDEELV